MTHCIIRKAEARDYAQVLRILCQVQQLHVQWRPDIYRENHDLMPQSAFEALVQNGTFYVAEADGQVVGILELVLRHTESPAHVTRNVIYIETMAVDEASRGQGIGHLFFEKAKELKKELHFDGIELQVNARNRAAYEMYARCGFTEKSINMELLE